MSSPEDPPKGGSGDIGSVSPEDASIAEARDATLAPEVGSVDELYRSRPEPTVVVSSDVSTTASGEVSTPPTSDEPIPPATTDLREAVGAAPAKVRAKAKAQRDADDDAPPVKRNRKLFTVAALSMLALLVITTLVLLGRANSARFAITCSTDHISAERGRSFPPWGTQPLPGAEYKPIALPPNAECTPRETDNQAELEGWYLDLLVERASATLTAPNLLDAVAAPGKGPNALDLVSDQLNQALLLSRAPERRDQRKEVERLLGDVQYWRASLRLRDASAALLDASRQFEAAAQQRPRHVTDAAAWASFVKKLADDLHAGPNGAPAPTASMTATPTPDHPLAPAGTALPVEPTPTEPSVHDTPPAPPDAGVPTGGVLL